MSPYVYAAGNPLKYVDPDGKVFETVVDVVSVVLSLKDFIDKPTWGNASWLAGDVAGAVIPFVPSIGIVRHAGKVDDILDASKATDKTTEMLKLSEDTWNGLTDGQQIGVDEVLQKTVDYLGEGYKEVAPGVYRSADGTRQVRMTTDDLTDKRGPHLNFEKGETVKDSKGRESFKRDKKDGNKHIYIEE
jgi:hypothetical protein